MRILYFSLNVVTGLAVLLAVLTFIAMAIPAPAPLSTSVLACEQSCNDIEPVQPTSNIPNSPQGQEMTTPSHSRFKVVEASPSGLFIRVATDGKPTVSKAKEIIKIFASQYDRIDICAPEFRDRGKECMSFMNGVLIDYHTGESITIEP